MKYLDEYRDAALARKYSEAIHQVTSRSWNIMEVCGGQTHAIMKYRIEDLLPDSIILLHGPGCPVCVTPIEYIDKSIAIASIPDVILCSFGDMLRVPGSVKDLLSVKAEGCDVRMVYSPMDALMLAQENKDKRIVFFGVGFETTAPANAMAVYQADKLGITNFSMLVSQVRLPPALELLLSSPQTTLNGFLAAGHVCAVMGYEEYEPIAEKYKVPIVVTGFEPVDILQGIYMCVKQLESGQAKVENQYTRALKREGNIQARKIMYEVFKVSDREWRGIGLINQGGLSLKPEYARFDAEFVFENELTNLDGGSRTQRYETCISGRILQGIKKPDECPHFGKECTREHPLGPTMVSGEGACSAYIQYGRE